MRLVSECSQYSTQATLSSPSRRLHSPGAGTARCGRPPACGTCTGAAKVQVQVQVPEPETEPELEPVGSGSLDTNTTLNTMNGSQWEHSVGGLEYRRACTRGEATRARGPHPTPAARTASERGGARGGARRASDPQVPRTSYTGKSPCQKQAQRTRSNLARICGERRRAAESGGERRKAAASGGEQRAAASGCVERRRRAAARAAAAREAVCAAAEVAALAKSAKG